jgi:hypothetical protein
MVPACVTTGRCCQVAGWGGLIAGALLLASLFDAGVTNGTRGVEQTFTDMLPAAGTFDAPYVQSGIHEDTNGHLSPATAALAGGEDLRARLLADPPAANCAMQPLYAGQTSWVPVYSRCTDALP